MVNTDATRNTVDGMQEEADHDGIIRTHTYYGRGWPPSAAEMIANVVVAFRFALGLSNGRPIIMIGDEDVGFAVTGLFNKPRPGDEDGMNTPEGRIKYVADCRMGQVATESDALVLWFNDYAYDSDSEDVPGLMVAVAEAANVPLDALEHHRN